MNNHTSGRSCILYPLRNNSWYYITNLKSVPHLLNHPRGIMKPLFLFFSISLLCRTVSGQFTTITTSTSASTHILDLPVPTRHPQTHQSETIKEDKLNNSLPISAVDTEQCPYNVYPPLPSKKDTAFFLGLGSFPGCNIDIYGVFVLPQWEVLIGFLAGVNEAALLGKVEHKGGLAGWPGMKQHMPFQDRMIVTIYMIASVVRANIVFIFLAECLYSSALLIMLSQVFQSTE